MQIDRNLNLVVPRERLDGVDIYVHATPISRAAFDQNFLLIAKTFTAIYSEGLGFLAGPRVAAKMLKKLAEDEKLDAGPLLAEMRRLANVVAPGPTGWAALPLDVAISQKTIDESDVEEVENVLTFFMLVSAMHRKPEAKVVLTQASRLWAAELTSLSTTAFIGSLPTPTASDGTGPKTAAAPFSIPS